jgi:hypothetical protein
MAATVPLLRDNEIVFVAGKKASGKSTLLYEYFVANYPRTISLDFVGDVKERNPEAIEVVGYTALLAKLKELVAAGVHNWHVAAVFDSYTESELPNLFRLLCPPYNPQQVSFSRAIGGLALECSECDVILPNGGAAVEARNMVKRGRHNLLSLFLATQRPQECSRLCTSQADYIISFAMHEPNELKYFGRISPRYASLLQSLPKFHSAWYVPATGQVAIRDGDGETVATYNFGSPANAEQLQL